MLFANDYQYIQDVAGVRCFAEGGFESLVFSYNLATEGPE